ncbi:MAG TPA: thiol:disulfide interchange protein DsbA/DsbL [Rhodocyclaceae bacterium]
MNKLRALIGTLFLLVAGMAGAQQALREGVDYSVLAQPQPTERGKIEVTEFFSYMCPHCAHFEPVLEPWVKALPKDVVFHRVPVVFRPQWEAPARLYLTLETMNEVDRLQVPVFNAIHVENSNLTSDAGVMEWIAKKGVDARKFSDVYNSFALQSKLLHAKQATAAYGIDSVPSIVVAGKYRAPTDKFTGTHEDLLKVVNALIVKARREQKR